MPFKKGQIGWSRGLTKYTNTSIAKNANSREGMFVSEATRHKISKSCKGRTPWNKGTKGVVVAWSKGLTKETSTSVARMAKTLQGHTPWNKGRHHTEESRLKMSLAHKGQTTWNTGLTKDTDKRVAQVGENHRGLIPWNKGKHHTEQSIAKIRLAHIGQIAWNKGLTKYTDERVARYSEKVATFAKKRWQDMGYRSKMIKALRLAYVTKPNKPEQQLLNILNNLYPNQWQYTGDGKPIRPRGTLSPIKELSPDFWNGDHKVIELFGDYWHSFKKTGRTKEAEELYRKRQLAELGFDCLIIWERELKHSQKVTDKINVFYAPPMEVIS